MARPASPPLLRDLEHFHDRVRVEPLLFDGVVPLRDDRLERDGSRQEAGLDWQPGGAHGREFA